MRRPYKRRKNPEKIVFVGSADINKFIKSMMFSGKLHKSYTTFMSAIDKVLQKQNIKFDESNKSEKIIEVFNEILEKGSPSLEVRTKRVGGANYQVPVEISSARKKAILYRWIFQISRKMVGAMSDNLAKVFLDILDTRGDVIRKKEELHKMAAANRVFQNLGSRG